MGTMNISLPDPMKNWVEDQAKTGRYANSSDYVRDLIRRDRARLEAIAELQAAVDSGLASGPAQPLDRCRVWFPISIEAISRNLSRQDAD